MWEEVIRALAIGAIVLLVAAGVRRMFPRAPTWTIWTLVASLAFVVIPVTYEGPRTWIRGLPIWAQYGVPLVAALYLVWLWLPEIKEKGDGLVVNRIFPLKAGLIDNLGFFIEFPSKARLIFQIKMPPIRLVKPAPLEGHAQSGVPEISGTLTMVSPPLHRRAWNRPLVAIFVSFVYVMCLTISGLLIVKFAPNIGIPFFSVFYALVGVVMAVQPLMLMILNPRALTWRAMVLFTLAVLTMTMPVIMREMLKQQ